MDREKTRQLHDDLIKSSEEGDVRAVVEALPILSAANCDAVLNGATLDRKCALYLYVLLACVGAFFVVVSVPLKIRSIPFSFVLPLICRLIYTSHSFSARVF